MTFWKESGSGVVVLEVSPGVQGTALTLFSELYCYLGGDW